MRLLAAGGRALELAIGTGRVAVPLAESGVPVAGIELSAPMVDRLREKVDAAATFANDTIGKDAAWTQFLTKPSEASQIVPIAFSRPIPSDNIAIRRDLDPALASKIKHVFLGMCATPAGRKQLWDLYRIDTFVDATPADFEPVREAFAKVGFSVK